VFASIRRYRLESGSIDDMLRLVDTDFADTVQELDGFVEYQVVECGNGEIVTITTFTDRAHAEGSMDVSADWVRDTLARRFDLARLEAFVGEVVISRAQADVLEPERY
jgi:quinol monooxygenase YgiN